MRTLAVVALCGLVLSAVVHIAAFLGTDIQSIWPSVWILHVGIFVVFVPMVLIASSESHAAPAAAYFPGLPSSAGIVMVGLGAYATISFFIFAGESMNGSPAVRNDTFVLEHRGNIVRALSPEEFKDRRAAEVRGMSGHWLLFYYVPFVFFISRTKPLSPDHPHLGGDRVSPPATPPNSSCSGSEVGGSAVDARR